MILLHPYLLSLNNFSITAVAYFGGNNVVLDNVAATSPVSFFGHCPTSSSSVSWSR
jgi:hypothetical protein